MEINQNPETNSTPQENRPLVSHSPIVGVPPVNGKKEAGLGSAVAVVVIIGLAVLGLYYLSESFQGLTIEPEVLPTIEDVRTSEDAGVQSLLMQGSSDEISSVEADLESTDLSEIDVVLTDIESSLGQ